MPRPEQTPASQFKGLPYGTNALANAESSDLPDPTDPSYDEFADMPPPSPEEQFLLSPSDRPNESITSGMSFGPGPNFTRFSYETEPQMKQRISAQLANDPSPDVQEFRAALDKGL